MRVLSGLFMGCFLLVAVATFGQEPVPTGKVGPGPSEGTTNEVFAGYLYQLTDWGPLHQNGLDVNFTHFFGQRFGAVADFDWAKSSDPVDTTAFAFRAGPRYNLVKRSHNIVPYVNALFGGARLRAVDNVTQTNGYWHGFTWALGGGVEVNINKHLGARFQGDWTGLPYGNHDSSQWQRLAFGVTYKF